MLHGSGIFVLRINKHNDIVIIFYDSWRKGSIRFMESIVENYVLTAFVSSTPIFHHPLSVNLSAFYENPVVPETKY